MINILDITDSLNIPREYIQPYGWDKAKLSLDYKEVLKDKPNGKLVLVTAITPTKAGEGKTTTTIGLHDGLRKLNINSIACLREPSLGPVWGIKGGAVGALNSTIIPSDDINLHFTGDYHALTSTINLMSAIIDNHIYQGNELKINPDKVVWTRSLDINDRALRSVTVAQDDKKATPRHDEFTITVASELMTILTISQTEKEFIERVNKILVAYDYNDNPIYFGQFNCSKAILKMMRNAMNPNIVQTLEGNPVLVHCGPFANISIGVNSINATKMALKMADVVVTEAGFGSDLGAEKFLDIKCQEAGISPDVVVLVATVRALKLHGGVPFEELDKEDIEALLKGTCNLKKHYENLTKYGVPVIVAINRFPTDTGKEINTLFDWCDQNNMLVRTNNAALDGSDGAVELASAVINMLGHDSHFKPLYDFNWRIKDKIETICKEIYGAKDVEYTEEALQQIDKYETMGYGNLPVCISKTPNSLTDNPKILGRPENFTIHIREVRLYAGAGLIVPLSGTLMLLPGLPKEPRCLDKFN